MWRYQSRQESVAVMGIFLVGVLFWLVPFFASYWHSTLQGARLLDLQVNGLFVFNTALFFYMALICQCSNLARRIKHLEDRLAERDRVPS
jgi:hypothetical protein